MDTLEAKKKEIKDKMALDIASAEFEHEVKSKFPLLEIMAYIRDWKGHEKTANFKLETKDDFKKVFKEYPPTNEETIIGYAGKDSTVLKSPYRLDLENPCRQNNYSRFEVKIQYMSDDINMRITLPVEAVQDFVKRTGRSITDSEHHYFTGTSRRELNEMRVTAYHWNGTEQIGWYGGNRTLTNIETTNKIIEELCIK